MFHIQPVDPLSIHIHLVVLHYLLSDHLVINKIPMFHWNYIVWLISPSHNDDCVPLAWDINGCVSLIRQLRALNHIPSVYALVQGTFDRWYQYLGYWPLHGVERQQQTGSDFARRMCPNRNKHGLHYSAMISYIMPSRRIFHMILCHLHIYSRDSRLLFHLQDNILTDCNNWVSVCNTPDWPDISDFWISPLWRR